MLVEIIINCCPTANNAKKTIDSAKMFILEKIKAEAAKAKLEANPSIMAKPEMVAPVEVDIPPFEPGLGIKVEDVNDPLAPPKTVTENPNALEKAPVEEETPMPDSIAEIVRDTVEAAKKAKSIKKNIKISETALPDVDEYIKNP